VRSGYANGATATHQDKGSLFLVSGSGNPTVRNCYFTAGRCTFGGGVGYVLSAGATFADCQFVNNIGANYELDAILAVVMGGTLMSGGRFSIVASIIGAMVIWAFTITMYTFGVPADALTAAKAVLVLLVILLYSEFSQRLLGRWSLRKGPSHDAAH